MPYVRKQKIRRMSRAQLLALATTAGTAAALLMYFALARQTQGAQPQTIPVVIAAEGLSSREMIKGQMLRTVEWKRADCPSGVFQTPGVVIGQVTAANVPAGQPITRNEVMPLTALAGLAPEIAPSLRAVSIALDPAGGSVGFLEPGDHVDVLATFDRPSGQSVAQLIVSDAQLLALGTRSGVSSDTQEAASSAMLEVSPREAQALALAAAHGRLTIALRGLGDDSQTHLPVLSSSAPVSSPIAASLPALPPPTAQPLSSVPQVKPLLPLTAMPATASPEPLPQITVVRGTQRSTITVGP